MKTIQELWAKGLAVLPLEVRGARPDTFNYTHKKTGQRVDVFLVRVSFEMESGGSFEAVEGSIGGPGDADVKIVPEWCVRGSRVLVGCSEVKREMRRLSVRVVDVAPVVEDKTVGKKM